MMNPDRALVILSGGQDSTTCLFWAKRRFGAIHALTFDYGQRHQKEIQAAVNVAGIAGVLDRHEIVQVPGLLTSTSPLVDQSVPVEHYKKLQDMPGGIEPTFVPCRNLLFLVIAANRAAAVRAGNLVIGVSQEDFGGYPDCREEFLRSARETINLAIFGRPGASPDGFGLGDFISPEHSLAVHAPLLFKSKAETVQLALSIPGCYEALAWTHTCYDGEYPPQPFNHASKLRAKGFYEAGVGDPLIIRAKREGLLPPEYPDHGLIEEGA